MPGFPQQKTGTAQTPASARAPLSQHWRVPVGHGYSVGNSGRQETPPLRRLQQSLDSSRRIPALAKQQCSSGTAVGERTRTSSPRTRQRWTWQQQLLSCLCSLVGVLRVLSSPRSLIKAPKVTPRVENSYRRSLNTPILQRSTYVRVHRTRGYYRKAQEKTHPP